MFSPGKLLLYGYHRPLARLRDSWRNGGPIQERRTAAGMKEMEAAAATLQPPGPVAGAPVEMHLMSGRRFWYQTAFCLHSFVRHSGRPVRPIIYDDGTLGTEHIEQLRRLFPATQILPYAQLRERLDR